MFAVDSDEKSYGSAELDKILKERRESLKKIKADLRRVDELQKEFKHAQSTRKTASNEPLPPASTG